MGEDSPLLTPEPSPGDVAARQKREEEEEDRLLTPEPERTASRLESSATLGNGLKRKSTEDLGGAIKQTRTESTLSLGGTMAVGPSSAEKYKKIKKVGVGAYGAVFMAENLVTKEICAVKVTTRKEDPQFGGFPVSLLREIVILRSLKHDNIVQLHELAQTSSGDTLMVMEYCQSSLLELLNSRKHDLSFSEVKYIIRQVLDATRHMHERGILHRDLATKNVLFNLSGEIKVCDFGISRFAFGQDEEFGFVPAKNLENPNMIVSLPYRAVELLLGQAVYGPALDVWSAGCILGEILLCQGGARRTFFGGDPENPNKTPQATVEEIFRICGRPTETSWPGHSRLPLFKGYASTSAVIDRLMPHSEQADERAFIRRFFTSGVGECAHRKYHLTESCFDHMGGLLTLCPDRRQTAAEALGHSFFKEKPLPEWHAWHWATNTSDIARGDEMKRQEKDAGDEARTLLRKLSGVDVSKSSGGADGKKAGDAPKTAKEAAKEALERRASERKKQEEQRLAAEARARQAAEAKKAAAGRPGGDSEKMPPGWSKHWSSSKQRYYYHDQKSGKNLWHPPSASGR
eukprot:TRINITY_DN21220_c0_g1_i1.p1 TRINITY_DN21220_c0_g1~~TRINITY_DN21220_c0_g1_i1.p1  ORF type:complete len:574 (+),score=149.03 TRINITY_DN21220_c0_g1_i1:121-1842(+)